MHKKLSKAKDMAYFVLKKHEVAPLNVELLSLTKQNMDACFSCTCGHPYKVHCYDCDILTCEACGVGPNLYKAHARMLTVGRHFGK